MAVGLFAVVCSCVLLCSVTVQASCIVDGVPVACNPPEQTNIAAGVSPIASNTCGESAPERVCFRAGSVAGYAGECGVCDSRNASLAHPASLMTDPDPLTYWQSQTFRSVQNPNSVVITLSFNKTYAVSSVAVLFQSARPESFAILVSADRGSTFTPLHYFSRSCNATYGIAESAANSHAVAEGALCTADGAQPIPLAGGRAVYNTASYGRGAVLATDIRLRLDRLNTFGDEQTWDPKVLDSYFYAISNVEVSASCYCNGHASSCSTGAAGVECNCTHNTAGQDCQHCLSTHNDQPWSRATEERASQCVACDCSGHSSVCQFDMAVFIASGNQSGSVCEDCQHNTTGQRCERCRDGFYPNPGAPITSPEACLACACDPRGTQGSNGSCSSAEMMRNATGQCICKAAVESTSCSQCKEGFFGLSQSNPAGCEACDCSAEGSLDTACDSLSGQCRCRPGYTGRRCDRACGCDTIGRRDSGGRCTPQGVCQCKPGVGGDKCDGCLPEHFGLGENGCQACNCHPNGSLSNRCDPVGGQCPCQPGYSHRDCSLCPIGSHDIGNGCVSCPGCYQLIEEAFNRTTSLLTDLMDSIARSRNTSLIDRAVVERINMSRTMLTGLQMLLARLSRRESRLRANVSSLVVQVDGEQSRVLESTNLLDSSERSLNLTEASLSETVETLRRLMAEATVVENRLQQRARDDLRRAKSLHDNLQSLLHQLIVLVQRAANISLQQQQSAMQLLDRAVLLASVSTSRLTTLCNLLERQNDTLTMLRGIEENQLESANDVLKRATDSLEAAVRDANNAATTSDQLQEMVRGLPTQNFMADQLLTTAESLKRMADEQLSMGSALNELLALLRVTFTVVSPAAQELLASAQELNRTATDLLMRAHAARARARMSVTEGNTISTTADRLLMQLQTRLVDVTRFQANLQRLLELINRAESTSNMAASEANRQAQEVLRASTLVDEATSLLMRAARSVQQAIQLAMLASSTANTARQEAVSLRSGLERLPAQVEEISSKVDTLTSRRDNDTAAINEANSTITAVSEEASSVQRRVADIISSVDNLAATVNSSRLLSRERIMSANETLTRLLSQVENITRMVATTKQQVSSLEQQTIQLRERYTELLQHRDLLLRILGSIDNLKCNEEFL